ncbi:MAG: ABC transporter ATP-binding protein [Bacteroidetes bacterium]|nr:ABC transporter ATP-binding protein [Bacteroidota bacterium]MCH8525479.1 ABC transporter ATP-binding protein [Balneolales bacterium]
MIKTQHLTKRYITSDIETTALNDVSLTIDQGDFVAIMGPSGCGKSTLLNVLGLLDNPSEGQYVFMDSDVSDASERERALLRKHHVGFVFQSFNLIDELTVFENIELPLIYQGMSSINRKKRVGDVLERLEIAHRSGHFPYQLSGGQQQRVAICRAIVGNQKLIFADEPTGNLDSVNGADVMKLLRGLNSDGTTVVMVTHSDTDASYAKRIVRLKDGKVA